ncbi:MAG: extracellular solute-binding protein [Acutalibacteraceae bacterium]|nr:extracellular solute-binding protein [Acutalibacteraceae bacterium]
MLKRILTILLAVAMVLSMCAMAGCKDNGGQSSNKPVGNVGSSQNEEEYFLDMPSELRGTTVKFATWIDHAQTDTKICLSGFEETTGMKYEMVQVNQSDYVVKMTALISADQSPDVVVENGDFPKTLNLLQPLSKETNGLDPTDPFWDQRTSELFHIGKNYYLVNGANSSWLMTGAMTYFHKTLLEENGIKTPAEYVDENNWNTDTLWTLMNQIKSACGLSDPGTTIVFDNWLSAYGGGQYKFNTETDKFENAIQSTESKKAIDYLMRGKDAGLLKIISNHDDGITKASHAVQICGAYGLRKNPGWFYTMDVDDLGFAVLPKLNADDTDYPYTSSERAYGICKGAKNAKGAAYFLRYFLNQDHYDMDEMFKNAEAKEMYLHLREKGDISKVGWAVGVGRVTDPSYFELNLVQPLLDGTAAQVSVNLASVSSKLDGAANAANELLEDFIAAQ